MAIFIATGTVVFSQNCKFEKNEVDKFTKTEVKLTKPILAYSKVVAGGMGGTDMLNLQAEKNGDKYSLLIKYIYTSRTAVFYNESEGKDTKPDAKLMFLLDNDSIITAIAENAGASVSHKTSAVNTMDMRFEISYENIQQLKIHTIKNIRICKSSDISQTLMEGEVKPKYSQDINKVAGCVVE